VEKLILEAITNKQLIEFYYRDLRRIAEPHVYGVTNGVWQILSYQTGGQSSNGGLPDWRRFDLDLMSRLAILAQIFPGPRPIPSGKHSSRDSRVAIVC
jgi:predicted DNA-binding transcriptional regulator YafY